MRISSLIAACVAVQVCALAAPAAAHDAWTEPRDGGYVVLYGHGDKQEGYLPAKIKSLAAFDAAGAALPISLIAGTDNARFTVVGQPSLLTLHFDNGVWSTTAEGSKNLPKSQVPGALRASHSVKYGKTALAWGAAVTQVQAQQLEILPLSAEPPKAGGSLPVQVLWRGQPLPNAKITSDEYDKDHAIEADANGKASVPVKEGRQMIAVNHRVPVADNPDVDTLSIAANFIFAAGK